MQVLCTYPMSHSYSGCLPALSDQRGKGRAFIHGACVRQNYEVVCPAELLPLPVPTSPFWLLCHLLFTPQRLVASHQKHPNRGAWVAQ